MESKNFVEFCEKNLIAEITSKKLKINDFFISEFENKTPKKYVVKYESSASIFLLNAHLTRNFFHIFFYLTHFGCEKSCINFYTERTFDEKILHQ